MFFFLFFIDFQYYNTYILCLSNKIWIAENYRAVWELSNYDRSLDIFFIRYIYCRLFPLNFFLSTKFFDIKIFYGWFAALYYVKKKSLNPENYRR